MNNGYSAENDIYILLTDTGTVFARLIKKFTDAPYNHASIAFDAELKELYSFGRKQPTNPWDVGFVQEDVYAGTYQLFPHTRCSLLRLQVTSQHRAAIIQSVRGFEREKDTYRYNLLGLLGLLIKLDLSRRNSYFCSQFVAEVLQNTGSSLWTRPSTQVTPNDFLEHPAFELIYEGFLLDYPLIAQAKSSNIQIVSA